MEIIKKICKYFKNDQSGSLTIIAIFTILIFSLYGILLYAKSASAYIRQTKSIETIKNVYARDVPNAAIIAKQLGGYTEPIIEEEPESGDKILVLLDASGGSISSSSNWQGSGYTATKKVRTDSKYGTLPVPSKPGYIFLGWREMPSDYQTVEYIESDMSNGTQYINTRFVPNQDTRIVTEFEYTENKKAKRSSI